MAMARVVMGVSGDGFITTVQPAANALISFRQGRKMGKFHLTSTRCLDLTNANPKGSKTYGESKAAGPTGSRIVKYRIRSASAPLMVSPLFLSASPAINHEYDAIISQKDLWMRVFLTGDIDLSGSFS